MTIVLDRTLCVADDTDLTQAHFRQRGILDLITRTQER